MHLRVALNCFQTASVEVFKLRAGSVSDVNFDLFEHFVNGLLDPEQVKAVLAPHCPPFLEYRSLF